PRCPCPQDALEVTGTFKQCKSNLVKEGFDPSVVRDRLFFRDEARKSYVPLSADTFAAIRDTKISV
ncbi:S27A2 synthetase, partial [Pardalotus punctatus]|nr:S27A2 synthetase [Pardalotus punctatus]